MTFVSTFANTSNSFLDILPSTVSGSLDITSSTVSWFPLAITSTTNGIPNIRIVNSKTNSITNNTADITALSSFDLSYASALSTDSVTFVRVCNVDIGNPSSQYFLYYGNELIEREIKKQRLKNNLLIRVNQRQRPFKSHSPAEEKARNTLRDMLTEADWRRYITNGFVMVKGVRYWYQIYAKGGVNVYFEGNKINHICIHTDDSCPPSDHVINMISLIEFDEMAIWRFGNVKTPEGHLLRQASREKQIC